MLTATGMTLILLTMALALVDTAFAVPEVGCSGGCRKNVNRTCTSIGSDPCTGDSHCGCPGNTTILGDCPCGFQN